jgi:hypothetical protein
LRVFENANCEINQKIEKKFCCSAETMGNIYSSTLAKNGPYLQYLIHRQTMDMSNMGIISRTRATDFKLDGAAREAMKEFVDAVERFEFEQQTWLNRLIHLSTYYRHVDSSLGRPGQVWSTEEAAILAQFRIWWRWKTTDEDLAKVLGRSATELKAFWEAEAPVREESEFYQDRWLTVGEELKRREDILLKPVTFDPLLQRVCVNGIFTSCMCCVDGDVAQPLAGPEGCQLDEAQRPSPFAERIKKATDGTEILKLKAEELRYSAKHFEAQGYRHAAELSEYEEKKTSLIKRNFTLAHKLQKRAERHEGEAMQLELLKGSGMRSQCTEYLEEFKAHVLDSPEVNPLEAKLNDSGVEKSEIKDFGAEEAKASVL